ncbi:hypothetical protein, partial [uncultured Abyssibacter sp.]|uniref:hypothetical protein n=1 Tax=uncultured Abyssibacter sp. TaxID=2320202 RepID=UPI0032B278D7
MVFSSLLTIARPPVTVAVMPTCPSEFNKAKDGLDGELAGKTDEDQVYKAINKYRAKLNGFRADPGCAAITQDIDDAQSEAETKVSVTLESEFVLKAGEELVVTVTRRKSDNVSEKTFPAVTYATPAETIGEWITLYGFNYLDSGEAGHFAKPDPGTDPQTYTITPKTNRQDKVFSPSIYFMWIKSRNYEFIPARVLSWNAGDVFGGVTAGLGFDLDSPTVFMGYGLGWGYNVMLTAGGVFHSEQRLDGKYNA